MTKQVLVVKAELADGIPSNKSYKDLITEARTDKYQGIPK